MAQPFQSRQHKRRLRVDEWPLEAAYRQLWEMVGQANRRLHDETRRLQESEGQAIVGGTGGPRDPDGAGSYRSEQCSVCDGAGEYEYTNGRQVWPVLCTACGGTGVITYRTARQVVLDAEAARAERETCWCCKGTGQHEKGDVTWACGICQGTGYIPAQAQRDSTLEAVARIRAAAVARDVDALPADTAASLRAMRADYVSGAKWNDGEDR